MTRAHNNHRSDRERQSEAALSRSRRESLEGLLCDLRDQELRRIKAYARNESAEGQSIGDELDRARQHEEIEFKVSLLELSERLLAAITSALARMRESKFEVCEECEQPISPAVRAHGQTLP